MAKLVLNDLVNLSNEQSAINLINGNSAAIETAMDKTLSRDGTSPNQMLAALDMNGQRVTNLPIPISGSEPARKADFDTLAGTIPDAQANADRAEAAADAAESILDQVQEIADSIDDVAEDAAAAQQAAQTATTQAGIATTQAGNAATSAGTATTQAGTATTQAGIATGAAGTATTQAGNASVSAAEANDWAVKQSAAVSGGEWSSKAHAIGGTGGPSTGASKDWATKTAATVDGSEYSSKEYAVGTTVSVGSAKAWATQTGSPVSGGDYGAKKYASDAAASANTAAGYTAALASTSTSSLAIATGSKSFTTQTGKAWTPGMFVTAASEADVSNFMHGQVTSYSGGTLIVNVLDIGGSGTKADWNIVISSPQGPQGEAGSLDFSTVTDASATYNDYLVFGDVSNSDATRRATIAGAVNAAFAQDSTAGGALTSIVTKTAPSGTVVGTTDTQTLTNKTLTAPSISSPTGLAKADVGLGNVDNTSDATKNSASATLTNKTLTAPVITGYTETLYAPSSGTSFTISLSNGTVQKLTSSGNLTVTLPSSSAGKSFTIMIAYGGSHTLTWAGGGTIKWAGGTTPTPTSSNGKIDIFSFVQDGTNTYGFTGGLNF